MSWSADALAHLEGSLEGAGWGYQPGREPASEPTALAQLALTAHARPVRSELLEQLQQASGAVGIGPGLEVPRWPTALAALAWLARGDQASRVERACDFLLRIAGTTFTNDDTVGQNTELVGWPWVEHTHSWVEPTSYALIALVRAGRGGHPRVAEARTLLVDRICAGGGWNYGCPAMLGNPAQPFPAPTGIALLALRDHRGDPRLATSVDYLAAHGPRTRSPISLPWALLGLAASGRLPEGHRAWLAESWDRVRRHGGGLCETALLLLAARPDAALELLATPKDG